MDQARQMLVFSLILLTIIIPVSLVFGWLATHFLVGKLFSPLEKILLKMKRVSVGALSDKINIRGNSKDELVRLAVSYNEMLDRLEEGITKQKDFATKVSHELKTPLTQAVLNLDIISEDIIRLKNVKTKNRVEEVKRELRQFGELINSLLALAKIKGGKIETKDVLVTELSKSIIQEHQKMLEAKKQRVELVADRDLKFRFSNEQWRIIFSNLLSNAIKYGNDNSKLLIKIGKIKEDGFLLVENQGMGLSAEEVVKVWKRFYRGEKHKNEEGVGIGLALVKEIAELNQLKIKMTQSVTGKIRVEIRGFVMI